MLVPIPGRTGPGSSENCENRAAWRVLRTDRGGRRERLMADGRVSGTEESFRKLSPGHSFSRRDRSALVWSAQSIRRRYRLRELGLGGSNSVARRVRSDRQFAARNPRQLIRITMLFAKQPFL